MKSQLASCLRSVNWGDAASAGRVARRQGLAWRLRLQVLADGFQPAVDEALLYINQPRRCTHSWQKNVGVPLPIVPAPMTPAVFVFMMASDYWMVAVTR